MSTVCHVFDETADWQQRVAANQLLDRLPRDKYRLHFASVEAVLPELSGLPSRVEMVPRIASVNVFAAPLLGRFFERRGGDLIHAWGPSAAAATSSASQRPLVVELFDAEIAVSAAKLLRTIARPSGFAIVCSTQWIRRRLVENGVSPELCVVIRPGIDFGAIQKVRKSTLRRDLDIAADDYVILLPEPASAGGPTLAAVWAGSLLNRLDGHYKVIVPGSSAEVERIARFAATLPPPVTLIRPGKSISVENLVAIADALVVPETNHVPTTAIAWAMGAGAAVIAAAGYAVTELVVTRVNGLLYKHPEGKSPALRIVPLLRDRESQRKVKEAARGQAYEVFSLRRHVEQHAQLYENLLAGLSPSTGIVDSAQVG